MFATVMYGPGDIRVENVPDVRLIEPTDALIRVTHAAICGSDLWPYHLMEPGSAPAGRLRSIFRFGSQRDGGARLHRQPAGASPDHVISRGISCIA